MSYTPNVKKLIIRRISMLAIPPGTKDPFLVGARTFLKPGYLAELWKEAEDWAQNAILAIKQTHDNPHGDDDEAIAGEILREVEERNNQ